MLNPLTERTEKMNENVNDDLQKLFDADKAQLKALAQVINEITKGNVPLVEQARASDMYMPKTAEFVTNKNIRNMQHWCNEYAFDDGELVHDLKSVIIELQYLLAVIKDLRAKIKESELRERELQDRLNHQATELQRLENLVFRDN
jgi:hypothetical protein